MIEAELVQIEQRAGEAATWREKWHSSGYHQGALSLQAVYGATELAGDALALVAEVRRLQGELRPLRRAIALMRHNPAIVADVVAALEPDA
jgi:hypothetical protein